LREHQCTKPLAARKAYINPPASSVYPLLQNTATTPASSPTSKSITTFRTNTTMLSRYLYGYTSRLPSSRFFQHPDSHFSPTSTRLSTTKPQGTRSPYPYHATKMALQKAGIPEGLAPKNPRYRLAWQVVEVLITRPKRLLLKSSPRWSSTRRRTPPSSNSPRRTRRTRRSPERSSRTGLLDEDVLAIWH
jgi:hypothetical protein